MSSSTPEARRSRLRTALSGVALAGGALLATATPALAAPDDATDTSSEQTGTAKADQSYSVPSTASPEALDYENAEGGGGSSTDPAAIDGEAPTPATAGAPYGEEKGGPEVAGVPLKGTADAVRRATSILPGAGPGDYA